MSERTDAHIWHFRYGEAHDDLRTAFYVDSRAYSSPEAAAVAVESARNALRKLRIIFEIELLSTSRLPESLTRPSWDDFKQRHFVLGEPLPVRGRSDKLTVPPSWEAMHEELRAAHGRFRAELLRLAHTAFPGSMVSVRYDRGPLRRSAGSIDWSEERYGFEVYVDVNAEGLSIGDIAERLRRVLLSEGWAMTEPGEGDILRATRDHYEIEMGAEPGDASIVGKSALYSAPPAPATDWVTEPR